MTPKELADEQSNIIFENDDVLFIEILGYQAMEYYGSESLNQDYKPNKGIGGDIYLIIDNKIWNKVQKKINKSKYYLKVSKICSF